MTFEQLWKKIQRNVSSIEEYCGGKFFENHTSFGMSEADGEENLFLLMGDGESNTGIDITQPVRIEQNSDAFVEDTDGNKISLRFHHKWEILDLSLLST